jgi:hypothetical protein
MTCDVERDILFIGLRAQLTQAAVRNSDNCTLGNRRVAMQHGFHFGSISIFTGGDDQGQTAWRLTAANEAA